MTGIAVTAAKLQSATRLSTCLAVRRRDENAPTRRPSDILIPLPPAQERPEGRARQSPTRPLNGR
jgi:hypothetical protein